MYLDPGLFVLTDSDPNKNGMAKTSKVFSFTLTEEES
jgi:hypothetical protein